MNNGNLIPAKKGEVRNPKGKPKGTKSFKTILNKFLESKVKAPKDTPFDTDDKITLRDVLALKLIKLGIEGNMIAIEKVKKWTEDDEENLFEGDYEMTIKKMRDKYEELDKIKEGESLNIADKFDITTDKEKK